MQPASQSNSKSGDHSSKELSGSKYQPGNSTESSSVRGSDDSKDLEQTEGENDAFSKFLKNMKEIAEDNQTDDDASDLPKW